MKKISFVCLLIVGMLTSSCEEFEKWIPKPGGGTLPPLTTVRSVDLNRYLGKWFEIASIPQFFSAACTCTQAEYSLRSADTVNVFNQCNLNSSNGPVNPIRGFAVPVAGSNNAKLKVSFPSSPVAGDYWILELAPDYSYAVVGSPSRNSLFILSRTQTFDEHLYQAILFRMKLKRFDITKVKKTLCQ